MFLRSLGLAKPTRRYLAPGLLLAVIWIPEITRAEDRLPELGGLWIGDKDFKNPRYIHQAGPWLRIVNQGGLYSAGEVKYSTLKGSSARSRRTASGSFVPDMMDGEPYEEWTQEVLSVHATGWTRPDGTPNPPETSQNTGTVTDGGRSIAWDNGSVWRRYEGTEIWIGDGNFKELRYVHRAGPWFWFVNQGGLYSAGEVKYSTLKGSSARSRRTASGSFVPDMMDGEPYEEWTQEVPSVQATGWTRPDGTPNPPDTSQNTGTVTDGGRSIAWDNGSVWRRYEGTEIWIGDGKFDHPRLIHRAGPWCWFVNEGGTYSMGIVESTTTLRATRWTRPDGTPNPPETSQNTGTVTDGGRSIAWDNGSVWRKLKRADLEAELRHDGQIEVSVSDIK